MLSGCAGYGCRRFVAGSVWGSTLTVSKSLDAAVYVAPPARPGRARWSARRPVRPTLLLAALSLLYGLAQIGSWRLDLGWDETIYVSQVAPDVPSAFFSAPRARGITLLAAPVASVTSDVTALRVWFTLLSALALFVVYRLWFRVVPPGAAVFAALVFGTLWTSVYYGPQVMPNLWVAFSAVAATGALLRVVQDPGDRAGLAALPVSLALMALMRPSDAAEAMAPLALAVLVVPAWRSLRPVALTYGGLLVGVLPWVIEAHVRFGGVAERLHQATAIQGGMQFNPSLVAQSVRTLEGPLLCRPCQPPPLTFVNTWWVYLVLPAVLAGLLVAGRRRRIATMLLPVLGAMSIGLPYLLLLTYTAPRFLLPSFALLSLPTGLALHRAVSPFDRFDRFGPVLRPLSVALVAVLLGLHVGGQADALKIRTQVAARNGNGYTTIATKLHRLGVTGSTCVISGYRAAPIAFYARCSSRMVDGHDASITEPALVTLSGTAPTAVIVRDGHPPPAYARAWPGYALPTMGDAMNRVQMRAYVSPSARR